MSAQYKGSLKYDYKFTLHEKKCCPNILIIQTRINQKKNIPLKEIPWVVTGKMRTKKMDAEEERGSVTSYWRPSRYFPIPTYEFYTQLINRAITELPRYQGNIIKIPWKQTNQRAESSSPLQELNLYFLFPVRKYNQLSHYGRRE